MEVVGWPPEPELVTDSAVMTLLSDCQGFHEEDVTKTWAISVEKCGEV
jgi:hypothetical protein